MNFFISDKNKWKFGMGYATNFLYLVKHSKKTSKNILSAQNKSQNDFHKEKKANIYLMKHNVVCFGLSQENVSDLSILDQKNNSSIRRYLITGSRRLSNYWWASVISLGGISFLLTGFSTFVKRGIFVFSPSPNISFLPQGLIMCFYGGLGLFFGIYLWCTIFWEVGNGFNEFNKKQGIIRIFRWGLPGKNRRIDLVYRIEQIEGVRVELVEGINPRRTISLRFKSNSTKEKLNFKVKDNKVAAKSNIFNEKQTVPVKNQKNSTLNNSIPLTRIGQPINLEDVESEASELAQFLQVPLDSFYEL